MPSFRGMRMLVKGLYPAGDGDAAKAGVDNSLCACDICTFDVI